MYAVVKTGGKQYRVAEDDKIVIDRIAGEAGDSVVFDQVLMMGDGDNVTLGTPVVSGAVVGATVLRQTRGPKVMVFRRKRRKNFRRVKGHRQDLTLVQITGIAADGKLKPPAKKAAPKAETPKAGTPKTGDKTAPASKEAAKKAAPKAGAPKAEAKAAPGKTAAKKAATGKKPAAKKAAKPKKK